MKSIPPFLTSSLANLAPSPPGEGGWKGGVGGDREARVYILAINPNASLT